MPDFAIDYGLLHEARKDLHALADRIGPQLKDSAFAAVGSSYGDADTVFGNATLGSAFRSLYLRSKSPMGKAEEDLRQLGDIFGAVADGYFDVDAQIANGMGMMGASLGLDEWRSDKEAWDYLQGHRSECVPDAEGKMPDFCSATDPGAPPTHYTVETANGSVTTDLTLDANNNVVKEQTTVVAGDQRYTSTTSYSGNVQTTDTVYGDGSTTHSVTTTGEHGSSVTDTTAGDGSTTHTVITLNESGGGTMTSTDAEGTVTTHTRPDRYASWQEVED
ncbi:hypothetical protein [Catenuloplanes japonicus]|uniref:hypothetical protein n=1 Tax=Catenuloplanes japonicus TaxID=33876 RepID=UPI000525D53C|nr:hypothetical protein [Catenuloplanes japonicus]